MEWRERETERQTVRHTETETDKEGQSPEYMHLTFGFTLSLHYL